MSDKLKEMEIDVFITNSTYPQPENIFKTDLKSLDSIINSASIIFDTNVLLLPYTISNSTLSEITKIYSKLTRENRLYIPGQVAREFAKNRPLKICELYKQLVDKKSKLDVFQSGKYPLLETLDEYKALTEIEKQIGNLTKEYKSNMNGILKRIRSWNWDDPVSLMYSKTITKDCIVDLEFKREEVLKELSLRRVHKIPPGYKDNSKDDQGVGDLLIWMTILNIGKQKNNDVIFVSGDLKGDWWHQSNNQSIYPRYELIDEFRRTTGDRTIHIIEFSNLLNTLGVSDEIVQEVRNEELKLKDKNVVRLPLKETVFPRGHVSIFYIASLYPGLPGFQHKVISDCVNYFIETYEPINEENFNYDDESFQYIHLGSYLIVDLLKSVFGDVNDSIIDKVINIIGDFGTMWVKRTNYSDSRGT